VRAWLIKQAQDWRRAQNKTAGHDCNTRRLRSTVCVWRLR